MTPAPRFPAMSERRAAKPLEWLDSARAAYLETLDYIARETEHAARQVAQRAAFPQSVEPLDL